METRENTGSLFCVWYSQSMNSCMRIAYIDIAKSIALFFVVLSHSEGSEFASISYGFMIPAFFLLSGMTTKCISLKQKAQKLLVPYFLFNLIILLLVFITGIRAITLVHWVGVAYSRYSLYPLVNPDNVIWMNAGNSPSWFLTAMFLSFVCLKGILFFRSRHIQLLLCLMYLGLTYLFAQLEFLLPWSLDSAFLFAVFMYAGIRVKNLLQHHLFLDWWIFLLGCIVYVLGWYYNGYVNLSVRDYGQSILLVLANAIVGTLLLIRIAMFIEKSYLGSLLGKLNKGAITIFCMQIPMLVIAAKIASFLTENLMLTTLFQLAFTLVTGSYLAKYFEPVLACNRHELTGKYS